MAELALAIAPLCLAAITGIKTVKAKLKIIRHHDNEMKRLRKKFRAQTDILLDECQLLLQECIEPAEAEALVNDTNDPRWQKTELNEQIRRHLGRKYEPFREAIEDVKDHIQDLGSALGIKPLVNTMKHNVCETTDLLLHKSKYESLIQGFKESNQEIKRMRKTASKIQRCQAKNLSKRSRPLPSIYQDIMHHSKSFYDAFRTFWSCFQAHTSHDVRLLLNSNNDGSLRIIVRYSSLSGSQVQL